MAKPDLAATFKNGQWRRSRPLKWFAWTVVTLVVLAALSWAALPTIVKKVAIAQTQEKIGRKLEIGAASFNPFRLALSVDDITLYEADGSTPFFKAKTLLVNASSASLLRLAPVLDEVRLAAPDLHVVRIDAQGSGRYNFSDILERIAAMPKSEGESRFSLANVQLQDGQVRFEDKVTGKQVDIKSLQLGLPFISNLPGSIDSFVQPQLSAVINGTPMHLQGRSKPFASSLESNFAIDIDKLDVVSYLPFSPTTLPLQVQGAKLSTKLDLNFVRGSDQPTVTLSGDITLEDLALADAQGAPLFKADKLAATIKQFDVLGVSGEISQVSLQAPQVWAAMNARGEINWLRALASNKGNAKPAAAPAPTPTPATAATAPAPATATTTPAPSKAILVQQLQVREGKINWRDEANATPAQSVQLTQLQIDAGQISTAADAKPATLKLAAVENGHGKISFDGQVAPLRAQLDGRISLDKVDINGYQNYLNGKLPARLTGKLSASAQVQLHNGVVQLPQAGIQLADSSVDFSDSKSTDKGADKAADKSRLQIQNLDLQLRNVSSKLDQDISFTLKGQLDKSGKLDVSGQAKPQFKHIELDLDAHDLPVVPFQGYFANVLNVTLSSGLLSAKGKLAVTPPVEQQALALNYDGSAGLSNLRMQDKVTATDFLRWRTLEASGIRAKIGGRAQVSVDKVNLANFYARVILSDKGRLNLQDILVSDATQQGSITDTSKTDDQKGATTTRKTTTSTAPVTTAAARSNAPIIRVGQVVLAGGNINYTDNFVKPNYTANMTGLAGSIGEISSEKAQAAPVNITGKIDNDAPLQISGTLNPLFKPMFLDIKASANGVQLPRLTPYSAKYAGYAITKGKLSMDVQYKIENDKLVAENDVRIEQLTFGERVDSPEATKLPVMLAVSLLKDRNGNINLNLPISGSLSDPEFSVGGIIVRVFINLIVKAVTSPFALIGSMFHGSEGIGELRYIEFKPGSSEITADIRKKLDALGFALNERPGIKLDITGRVDPKLDDQGLREEALERRMRALKRGDVIASEGQPDGPVQVTDAERAKLLERVYKDAKFDKPRNAIGFAKSLPPDEMRKLILDNTKVTADDLRALAQKRADEVRGYLQEQSIISADRIFLIAPKLNADGIPAKEGTTRVDLGIQ